MDNEEIQGVKFSQFPSETPGNADEVVGLHAGDNARFSIANIIAAIRQGLANLFVPLTREINNKALSSDITLDASDVGAVDASDVGVADGVASLDSNGKVPSSQLPPISSDAADITYDPTSSGSSATNVQDALDEAFDDLDGKQAEITASGILKGDGQGGVAAAVPGTDYQAPLTAGTDYATPAQLADKANQTQLAYVESGTTATRNYSAGEYICWNGLLYTADTAISSGSTFYPSGGSKNITECVGGGFNYLSGGMRFVEYPNLAFTFHSSQASDTQTISSIDSNLANAKAVIAWCTSQGTPIFPYMNSARTVIGIYSPSGTLNSTITVRLIAIY